MSSDVLDSIEPCQGAEESWEAVVADARAKDAAERQAKRAQQPLPTPTAEAKALWQRQTDAAQAEFLVIQLDVARELLESAELPESERRALLKRIESATKALFGTENDTRRAWHLVRVVKAVGHHFNPEIKALPERARANERAIRAATARGQSLEDLEREVAHQDRTRFEQTACKSVIGSIENTDPELAGRLRALHERGGSELSAAIQSVGYEGWVAKDLLQDTALVGLLKAVGLPHGKTSIFRGRMP